MRILFISDRRDGGIKRHVQRLRSCLPSEVEHYTIGEDEPFAGNSGHDWREFSQIRRVIKKFKPDIVHFHTIPLLMALYVKWICRIPKVCTIHTPSNPNPCLSRRLVNWAVLPCYWLAVSAVNWKRFSAAHPSVKGEVFHNPIELIEPRVNDRKMAIGMVGRNALVKDWPSFHQVAEIVGVEAWNIGEEGIVANAREKIREMALFVLTSHSEEMPTVVLECFAERTPICGFIPVGGMHEILEYSNGALREVFIEERNCEKLAGIARRILDDAELRERIVEDGWQIVTRYFDAEKNCRGRLMEIYREVIAHG